jgi:hypothetical protein
MADNNTGVIRNVKTEDEAILLQREQVRLLRGIFTLIRADVAAQQRTAEWSSNVFVATMLRAALEKAGEP